MLPSNGRRIVRALEVIALTGRPFPARLPSPGPGRYDAVLDHQLLSIRNLPRLTELAASASR